jgi:adenylate kinase
MRLLLLGPPGAGKGTQASILAAKFGVPSISTGDIFRANVNAGTPLGIKARAFMDRGEYVPDGITNEMVRSRLAEPDAAAGFLLDGYPRTVDQVRVLDELMGDTGKHLCSVLQLVVPEQDLLERLLKRGADQGRSDDTEDVIRQRLALYARQTEPLASLYNDRGLLAVVDGRGAVDDVTARLIEQVAEHAGTCSTSGVG